MEGWPEKGHVAVLGYLYRYPELLDFVAFGIADLASQIEARTSPRTRQLLKDLGQRIGVVKVEEVASH